LKPKLTIIGAGISGLYLAYLLQDKYQITILEARERIGGRIYSINGHDMGPSWIWQHHVHIQQLIEEFNLKLFLQYEEGYALYDTKDSLQRFIPSEIIPSARMEGTLNRLIDALFSRLKGVEILFDKEVISIEEKEDIRVKTKEKEYISDYLISTIPPRLTSKLKFDPPLNSEIRSKMEAIQTWMGNSAKCVCEFTTPFWQEQGLSGFVFSNLGPLAEIHDASTVQKNALFGFVRLKVDTDDFQNELNEQLQRVFQIDLQELLNVYTVDWKKEKYTAVKEDFNNLSSHLSYGIDTSDYSKKIFFSSTEFSFEEGGYLEGAIINAKKIAQKLL